MTPDAARLATVPALLARAAETHPDAPFLAFEDGARLTRAEVFAQARRVAGGLRRLGVRPGDAVAVFGGSSAATVLAWLGVNLAGAVEVGINPHLRGAVLEHALNNCGATVVVVDAALMPVLAESAPRLGVTTRVVIGEPDGETLPWVPFGALLAAPAADPVPGSNRDVASMIYTSGTSGPAKAVLMPHGQAGFVAQRTVDKLHIGPDDRFYCCHPLHHIAGKFMAVLAMLMCGGSVALDRRFEAARWLARIREERATVSLAHGPMVEMIFAQPPTPDDADHGVRRMLMVPFPKGIAAAFERRFRLRGVETWGMTEINSVCWSPLDEPLRPGSCGRPDAEFYDFRVVDPHTDEELPAGAVGEFVVRPKKPWMIMQGYHAMPAETVRSWRNFWFHSGDSGYLDADGYAWFTDRLGDRIRRRAENISSYEIESVAQTHEGVRECAAVAVPSEFDEDDDIKLVVAGDAEPEPLLAYLVLRLPHFMVPRYIERVAALPRTATNKVRKAELRAIGIAAAWDRRSLGVSLAEFAETVRP